MRFTEHELTVALTGAAKSVLAAQDKEIRKGRRDVDTVWDEMDRYRRFTLLDALGSQILPVLVALPDVQVAPGTRPTFTQAQVVEAVEQQLGEDEGGGRLRRKALVAARMGLIGIALAHLPPRSDPDALTVPDHL